MAEDQKARAESLGVKVDNRWSAETLAAEIAKAEQAKGLVSRPVEAEKGDLGVAPPKDQGGFTTRTTHLVVKLKNGYWPEDGSDKVLAGSVVQLRVGEARRLLNEGKAELVLPPELTGEDEAA